MLAGREFQHVSPPDAASLFPFLLAAATLLAEDAPPSIGSEIPDLKFKDIRYLTRSLKDFGEKKAIVLVFTNTTCPLAQKYWPKLKRLRGAIS